MKKETEILEPKKVLGKFLFNWKEKNWNRMYDFIQLTWKSKSQNTIEVLSCFFLGRNLRGWKIIGKQFTPFGFKDVVVDFKVFIIYENLKGKRKKGNIFPRLICEKKPYETSKDGIWGVNPLGILKYLNKIEKED